MRVKVYKTGELDPEGVTPVWQWKCQHTECYMQTTRGGNALFWENALRGAHHHIEWHRARRNANA